VTSTYNKGNDMSSSSRHEQPGSGQSPPRLSERRAHAHTHRVEAEVGVLLRELREHVDSLAKLERNGLDSDELNREQTEIRRLRARIATLVRTAPDNRDAAA
jgi:hypothetical protein